MIEQILTIVGATTVFVGAMLAQTSPHGIAFQQPGWIAAPGYPTFQPDAQAGPVSGKPFSGTESRHTTQTLADGTHVSDSSSSLFYRDAEGRMRSESKTQAVIYDPIAGLAYYLNLSTRRYGKNPIRGNASYSIAVVGNRPSVNPQYSFSDLHPAPKGPSYGPMASGKAEHRALLESIHSHATAEDLPGQVVNGIPCRGSRITETIPAGTFGNDRDVKIVSERWYSDDLQVLVKTSNSDPRFGVTTYDLTNIVQAPPDQSLFRVPADYTPNQVFEFGGGVSGTPVPSKH
jgi:hypothetical protein